MEKTIERLTKKSIEAFCLSIEIYNKPTIKYRVEGFSLFICNAWELMLKAHMINKFGESSIYYANNPSRTISLENCIKKTFTNKNSPIHKNLMKIVELRNMSTHFITEEYEMVYVPLFQACVLNFVDKIQEFLNIDMTKIIPQNFLTLVVNSHILNDNEIRVKYPSEIANKLISLNSSLENMIDENNQSFAIKIEHSYYLTKDKKNATAEVNISNDAATKVKIIKELKDPNDTHKYTAKSCIKEINKRLENANIDMNINLYHFNLFCKYYDIKDNKKLCYVHQMYAQPQYKYSYQAIEFIFNEILKNPTTIIKDIKNKLTPGAKDSKR